MITWFTGNPGSGKSEAIAAIHKNEVILQADDMRSVWPDVGFAKEDRWANNLAIARLAKILEAQGFDILVATVSPYKKLREEIQAMTNCKFVYIRGGFDDPGAPYEQ